MTTITLGEYVEENSYRICLEHDEKEPSRHWHPILYIRWKREQRRLLKTLRWAHARGNSARAHEKTTWEALLRETTKGGA